jgi:Uncharacterized conserved protein related to C-terminal domain of eukaryotic chaperone, SACSIN
MREQIDNIISKADKSLDASIKLFEGNNFGFAVSRAYYSMFYMAEALLLTKGLSFSKHSGVISGLNQHFIKTGIFDYKFYDVIRYAFKQRNIGDYDYVEEISKEVAQKVINDAKEFLGITKKYLTDFK